METTRRAAIVSEHGLMIGFVLFVTGGTAALALVVNAVRDLVGAKPEKSR